MQSMINAAATQTISLDKITFSKGNRDAIDPNYLDSLAQSIDSTGLIQSILVLKQGDKFLCLAGECRVRACLQLKWITISARVVVQELSPEMIDQVRLVENLNRQDLTPWEEARQLMALQKLIPDATLEVLADRLGKSTTWVAQRLAFNKLEPKLRKLVQDQNWPLSHLPLLARMPAELQPAILEHIEERQKRHHHGWSEYGGAKSKPVVPTLGTLKEFLDRFQHLLSSARFKTNDALLVQQAGPCTACPKRSSAHAVLFPEIQEAKQDRCLDPECWELKQNTAIVLEVSKLKQKGLKPAFIQDGYKDISPELTKNLQKPEIKREWEYEKCKQGDKGAQPGVYLSGDKIGQVKWVKPARSSSGSTMPSRRNVDQETGKPKPLSTKVRLENLLIKRQCCAVELWAATIRESLVEADLPSIELLVPVAIAFGTAVRNPHRSSKDWDQASMFRAMTLPEMATELWRQVMPVLANRCKRYGPMESQHKALWEEAEAQADALRLDKLWHNCWATAVKTIKLPRALEKEGVEDPHLSAPPGTAPAVPKKKAKVK